MHLDRGISCTYRNSDGLSTRQDGPNTPTRQSAGTDDAPQGTTSRPCYTPQTIYAGKAFLHEVLEEKSTRRFQKEWRMYLK